MLTFKKSSLIILGLCAASLFAVEGPSHLSAMMGDKRVKAVWVRSAQTASMGFLETYLSQEILVGFDTQTGLEDTITDTLTNYTRPLISWDGNKVIFSNAATKKIYRINWDGTGKTEIASGIAGCLWYDTLTGKEYAYYARGCGLEGKCPVARININNPQEDTVVFNADTTKFINGQLIMVSGDAKVMALEYGWPFAGMFSLVPGQPVIPGGHQSQGPCWPNLPYDDKYNYMAFNDDHSGLYVAKASGVIEEVLLPCIEDHCGADHPKLGSYTTHLLCICNEPGDGEGAYGPGNIVLLKFKTDYTGFDDMVRLTTTGFDGFPDASIIHDPVGILHNDRNRGVNRISADGFGKQKGAAAYLYACNGRRMAGLTGKKTGSVATGILISASKSTDGKIAAVPILVH